MPKQVRGSAAAARLVAFVAINDPVRTSSLLKSAAVLAAFLVIVFGLAACGGSDDSTTSTSDATAGESGITSSAPGDQDEGQSAGGSADGSEGQDDDGTGDGQSDEAGSGDGSAEEQKSRESRDLPSRGKVSSNSAPFQKYSAEGKLHLAEFGEEASSGDASEAQTAVTAYLQAYAAEEWDKACEYLLTEIKAQLQQLTKTSSGCGETLAAFAKSPLSSAGGSGSPISAPEGIASLRTQEGGRSGEGVGFALFHGSDGADHWLAMKVQDGKWLILSATPQPFR